MVLDKFFEVDQMNKSVTDGSGNVVPNANWGVTDLSDVDMRQYPKLDLEARATISGGLTGPRYVRTPCGGIGDVLFGRILPTQSVASTHLPQEGAIYAQQKTQRELAGSADYAD
jgi:hypothetical protein